MMDWRVGRGYEKNLQVNKIIEEKGTAITNQSKPIMLNHQLPWNRSLLEVALAE
jgi:hypothetical protein